MNYTEYSLRITPFSTANEEIALALLVRRGFELFWHDGNILKAYFAGHPQFSPDEIISWFGNNFETEVNIADIPDTNWNEEWEKNFPYILIGDNCLVRAPFHTNVPAAEIEIIIGPKMSFGTGHHATTQMMMENILFYNFTGKTVLDAGCGTGILAILASKLNATRITAIDNDEHCFINARENALINNCANISVVHGEINSLAGMKFDVIFANINRNVLLNDLGSYKKLINKKGMIFLSGYLAGDKSMIDNKANETGFKSIKTSTCAGWVAGVFQLQN